ncbi:AAA family ATPase [Flavobacterium suzhouense]|uniref:AAA family ATPase n=1 Tax=Flavobacterium suzhouense TaxID=1529638 RepID=A0ABW5NX82_9FLAO
MRPIDIVGLKNFRIFDGQVGFLEELSPINILTGANNSGKSSVIKSLQMLKNSSKDNQFPLHLDLNQQEHLLGDFDNVLYNKDDRDLVVSLPFTFLGMKNLYISLSYTVPISKNTFQASLRSMEVVDKKDNNIVFSFMYREASEEEKESHKIKHEEDLKARQQKRVDKPKKKQDIFSFSDFGFFPLYNPLVGYVEWFMNLEKLKEYLIHLKEFYLMYLEKRNGWVELDKIDQRIKGVNFIPSILVNSLEADVDADSWNDFIDNKIGDRKEAKGMEDVGQYDFDAEEVFFPPPQIEDILYYYTLRIFRNKLIWNVTEDSGTKSSIIENCFKKSWNALVQRINTINYLSNIKEENARIYNANIGSPFINLLKDYTFHNGLDTKFINKYLNEFEIGKNIDIGYDPKYQLISVTITTFDGNKRELVDFGYGIKQLVLILIQISVLAEKSRRTVHEYDEEGETYNDYYDPTVLLVEEPESNLHPKWQSVLAEMFSEANTKFNIQLIIETHSEYLIRKFQMLVANQRLSADKVKLFYLRNPHKVTDEKKQVESLSIGDDGSIDFTKFDGGFFEESTDLKLSLLNIQRDNFLKEFEDLKSSSDQNADKIADLQQKIDEYTNKIDLVIYSQVIQGRFDITAISPISVKYLVSGQFLLNNIDGHDDFSPVILQYGRTVENELLQIFTMINPTKRWSFGAMQAALEKVLTGTSTSASALRGSTAGERGQLNTILASTFTIPANLRVDLLEDLRDIRNMAGHPGHTKARQDALDYIQDTNEFLDRWINEKI